MPTKRKPQKNAYYEFLARQKAERETQEANLAKAEASSNIQQKKRVKKIPVFPKSIMLALRSQRANASRELRQFSDIKHYDSVKVRTAQRLIDGINLAISKGKHNDESMRAVSLHRDWLSTQPLAAQKKYGYVGLNATLEGPLDYSTRRPGNGKLNGRNSRHQN